MALTRRQKALYRHRIDIWSVTETIGPGGKPSPETYSLLVQNVPAIYQFTPNIDTLTAGGRLKEFTMLVLDKIYMEASVPISDACVVVNVTRLKDGSKSNAWGQLHRVEGAPTVYDTLGHRHANALYVEAMSIEHPSDPIKGHYGL